MALTFTVSDLERATFGNKFASYATVTTSGTTTDNGDELTAAAVGLSRIEQLIVNPAVDSVTNAENVFGVAPAKQSDGTWKLVVFTAPTTPSATTAFQVITDGTTVSSYVFRVTAIGLP